MPITVRTIAGIKFERTHTSPFTRTYTARGALDVSLTYDRETDQWSGRWHTTHLYASVDRVSIYELATWLRRSRDRHNVSARAELSRRQVRVVRRRDSGVTSVACALGAYFFGVIIGAASVASKVAAKAA